MPISESRKGYDVLQDNLYLHSSYEYITFTIAKLFFSPRLRLIVTFKLCVILKKIISWVDFIGEIYITLSSRVNLNK